MKNNKLNLNLVSRDGNAFALLIYFVREAKKAGWDKEEISKVFIEATDGDYSHLLAVLTNA